MPITGLTKDWYECRDELEPEQVFSTQDGSWVKLERRVPGDGTRWYVADWSSGWAYYDSTIEPGDLKDRLADELARAVPGLPPAAVL